MTRLRDAGISEAAIEQAILVTAFFNYFPRVADGTGIEFDYESPLPRISIDTTREALPRIPRNDCRAPLQLCAQGVGGFAVLGVS